MSRPIVRRVAVIGPGDAAKESAEYVAGIEVGRLLGAYEGMIVVTGGLRGIMEAASRGAQTAGALTLGFLPGNDWRGANRWVRIRVPTGLGEARNALVVSSSEAVISVGGNWGTLSELALACKRRLPVASVGGWHVSGPDESCIEYCRTPEDAVAWIADKVGLVRRRDDRPAT